jgi:hypothetical protein
MAADTRRWAPFSLFYPVSFVVIAAMIWLAIMPGVKRERALQARLDAIPTRGWVVEGRQLGGLVVNDRASVTPAEDDQPYVVLSSNGVVTNAENFGARYWLPARAVKAVRDRTVEVGFKVRSAPVQGAQNWLVRIAITGVLDTGWQPQTAGRDWSTARVRVPIPPNDRFEPMEVILWSDARGAGGHLELNRIEFNVVPPDAKKPGAS